MDSLITVVSQATIAGGGAVAPVEVLVARQLVRPPENSESSRRRCLSRQEWCQPRRSPEPQNGLPVCGPKPWGRCHHPGRSASTAPWTMPTRPRTRPIGAFIPEASKSGDNQAESVGSAFVAQSERCGDAAASLVVRVPGCARVAVLASAPDLSLGDGGGVRAEFSAGRTEVEAGGPRLLVRQELSERAVVDPPNSSCWRSSRSKGQGRSSDWRHHAADECARRRESVGALLLFPARRPAATLGKAPASQAVVLPLLRSVLQRAQR